MTYFADGSPYTYHRDIPGPDTINMGWLDGTEPFPTGLPDPHFVEQLRQICRDGAVNRTRGFHVCNLCTRLKNFPLSIMEVQSASGRFVVGHAEIRVVGENGVNYAAPNMIIHYVETHQYRPPDEFVRAVLGTASRPDNGSHSCPL